MRFVHISDTHIGYSAYTALDPHTGRNQREVDIENAFRQAVDMILDIRPDFVIHSGDLFHTVRPSNRAVGFSMEEIARITDADIPFIVIAGNHSAPRMRETGSVFRIITKVKGVRAAYREKYERTGVGDSMIHLLPHVHGGERFMEQAALMEPSKEHGCNIAVLHAGVEGLRAFKYSTGEANEDLINMAAIGEGFDYIAFGHYHEFTELNERAYYSGATERLSFNDVGQEKGFIVVDTQPFRVEFKRLDIRPMMDLEPIDARGKSAAEVMADIEERASRNVEGAIVRLKINGISRTEYLSLDARRIKALFSGALHFEPSISTVDDGSSGVEVVTLRSMEGDFADFVRGTPVESLDKDRLIRMGKDYLGRAIEEGQR